MMRRRITLLLLAVLLLLPALPAYAATASVKVLLLYDSLAAGTSMAGNVDGLQRLLAAYSTEVTLLNLEDYRAGTMEEYSNVITVINNEDLQSGGAAYTHDLAAYQGKLLHIGYNPPELLCRTLQLSTAVWHGSTASLSIGDFTGVALNVNDMPYIAASKAARSYGSLSFAGGGLQAPFAAAGGQFTYVPYYQGGSILPAMSYVLRDWLGITGTPHTYLVLNEIYPFSDLELLEQMAERLYQSGIPFVASVRPVFSNTDFPAMERYAEALKFVQSRNGSIIVNAPAVRPPINSSDRSLRAKMESFIDVLAGAGIAPLGIAAENYWTYDKEYAVAGMGFFDSAVLYPNEETHYMEQTNVSKSFTFSMYSISPEDLTSLPHTGKAMPQLPLDTAVTLNLPQTEEGLEDMLVSLEASWISFADYKQTEHTVVTDAYTVASSGGVVRINGTELNVDYSPKSVAEDYQYQEEQTISFARLFSVQNAFFIVVIIAALLLFGVLLLIGRRLYLKKYTK